MSLLSSILKPIMPRAMHRATETSTPATATSSNTPPTTTTNEADAQARADQGKKSRNRFMHFLGKKQKPAQPSFDQALATLQAKYPRATDGGGAKTETDPHQVQPDPAKLKGQATGPEFETGSSSQANSTLEPNPDAETQVNASGHDAGPTADAEASSSSQEDPILEPNPDAITQANASGHDAGASADAEASSSSQKDSTLESNPDAETQANASGHSAGASATDDVQATALEEPVDVRTPHQVAQGILDRVKQSLVDSITTDVLDDMVAEAMEGIEDTAHANMIWGLMSANLLSGIEELTADALTETEENVTAQVQQEIEAGVDAMAQEILEHIINASGPTQVDIPPGSAHEIEETEPPQQTGPAANVAPLTPAQSAILDPQTHEIRQDKLKTLAADLGGYLDSMSGLLGASAVATLKEGLEQLNHVAGKKVGPQESSHGGVGLDARDCYKSLAKDCARLAKGAPEEQQEVLLTLRALFDELKRHHLSSAATPLFKEYAAAELEKMKKDNIGLVEERASAAIVSTGEKKIGIKVAKVQLEGKADRKRDMKRDEDNDLMNTDYKSASLGIGGAIKKILTLKGAVKLTKGGRYRKTGNFPNLAKIVASDESNHRSSLHNAMIGNSAGPTARKRDGLYQKWFKRANARMLHSEASAPRYLSSDKVAKGAYNTTAIHAAATMLDNKLGAPGAGEKTLAQIVKAAYPSLSDLSATPASAMDYAPIPTLSSGTTLRGKEKKTTITGVEVGLEGKAALPNFLGNEWKILKPGKDGKPEPVSNKGFTGIAEASGSVKARRVETALERLKPLHTMTTTGYTKDMRVSLNLLGTLEHAGNKNDTPEHQRINAKLALYRDINASFTEAAGEALPSHDVNFFGPDIDIPPTYLGTVRAPKEKLGALLDAVTGACDNLQQVYASFEEAAGTLHIANRGKDPQALKDDFATRRDAAAAETLGNVWKQGYPGLATDEAGQPSTKGLGTDSTKRREFIADSHDAISTALASVGTHLEIVKARILEEHKADPAALEREPLADILKKVDTANKKYTGLSKAIEAGNIPVAKNELYRYNSLAWAKVNGRNELEVQVGVKAAAQFKLISTITEQLTGKATGVIADINNSAAAAGLTLSFKYMDQDHPNFSRKGEFLEFSVVGAAGNPAAGPLMEKFMREVSKVLGGPGQFADTEGGGFKKEALKQAAAATSLIDSSGETQFIWRMHKYSEVPDSKYDFQSLKVYQRRKEGIGASLSVPTGAVDLEFGMKVGQENMVPVFEYMGRDIGHHIINYAPMGAALTKAEAAQKKEAADQKAAAEAGGGDTAVSAPKDKHAHLRNLLDKDENLYLKNQFFASNAIFDVVEDYEAFKNNRGDATKQSNFSFFHTNKLEESAQVAKLADATAAGKELKTALPTPLTEVRIAVPERAALAAAKEALKGMNADQRADYLLTTPEGQAVFDAYTKVLGNYKEINTFATTLHSYAPYLRQEEQSELKQTIARPWRTIKNAAFAATPFIGGVSGGDRKAAEYMSARGLFEEGRKMDLEDLAGLRQQRGVPDADATKQTQSWLAQHRMAVADNQTTGAKSMIIAYLQHATGDYGKLHLAAADKYLARLGEQGMTDPANPSQADLERVIAAINKDFGKSGGVRMMAPGAEGYPVWTGDVDHGQESQNHTVILRDRNEKGEETFSAVLHKGELQFDVIQSRKSADQMINQLENRTKVREHITNPENRLTGTAIREGVDFVEGKGRMEKFGKLASATLADYRNPIRKVVREMSDYELSQWIGRIESIGGRDGDVKEGRKEQEKRKLMKAKLGGSPPPSTGGEHSTAIPSTSTPA
ncbi:hypothetical protein [Pseudoduganella namucuonensis]|uniref:Uncharacterized protein n=1 Tax=Pseudoduganella namucuonensis TaxID=1035707 RepID=A0A1I7LWA5_9BURK|nr:hypothetical protein [Pseudoduganella namucuonensis]SFV13857.1 hypothetical protein SAMN05216552_104026 [Pseudoduganella namucuonensis]